MPDRIENSTAILDRVNELRIAQEHIIVVGGGMLQYPTFVETANMGYGTILIDKTEDCYCRVFANHFIRVSIKEPLKVQLKVKEFLTEHPKIKVVAVYTQGTDIEFTVACLAEMLGLSGVSSKVARTCNNKIECKIKFVQDYIPQPVFYYGDNLEKCKFDVNKIGYPCVIKPVDNCASRGLTIVNDESQIESAFENALANSIDQRYIVEYFIEGREYSVDTIVYNNKLYPAGISDREFIKEKGFAIQTGSLTPSLLSTEKQTEIYKVMERASKALGVNNSAFKGDIIITKKGEVLILEVTARLSGGFDSQYRKPLSYGINLIKATLDLALGNPLNFTDIIPRWVKFSKTFHIFPEPGVIKRIEGLDDRGHIKGVKGIHKVFWGKKIGDEVGDYRHCADRVVHIIGYADTLEELRQVEAQTRETLKVITE